MEELQLKHLAGYLPYGLKVCVMGESINDKNIVFELVGLDIAHAEYHEIGRTVTEQIIFRDCFPILRKLSDLTKEIEVNGEKFVPIEALRFIFNQIWINLGNNKELVLKPKNTNMYVDLMLYNQITEKLLEWHFNIHNLPEGIWIDINTLNK